MSNVNTNMFATAGVDLALAGQRPGLLTLPLNIIAVLVAHLDNVADLARLCRTCRVLNYMALPQLYKDLTLTSYDKFRYRDEFVEGCGSGSPFSMALNAVVTRNVGGLVRSLTLRGEWRENELEEHARVGRVPDSSMMLNIVVRAAVDKMPGLESVSWELNTKMLQTVYQGLAQLPRLKSLTVRFPSSRHPRPTIVIPAMPHLRALKITDIDPLCYPDDLSTLLYQSKKLRELRLHWSPRMQEAQEASVNFTDYFRKCIAAKSPVKLKKVAFQNLYSLHREEIMSGIDYSGLEDITIFTAPFDTMSFVENSWPMPTWELNLKSIRFDRLDKRSCELLGNLEGLEKFYLVTGIQSPGDYRNSPKHFSLELSTILTPDSSPAGRRRSVSANDGTPSSISNIDNFIPQSSPTVLNFPLHVRDPLFQVITSGLGSTLRHLLLPSRWTLPPHLIARLVRACPQLEQLALATEMTSMETLSLLLPFLRKLVALRLLIPTPYSPSDPNDAHLSPSNAAVNTNGRQPPEINARSIAEVVDMDDCIHNEVMGVSLADMEIFGTLKIIGLGWKAWELGALYTIPASKATQAFLLRDENAIALKYHSAPDDLSDDQLVEVRFSIPESILQHRQASLNAWPTTSSPRGKRKRRSYSGDLNGDSSINNHSPVPNPNSHQNTLSSPSPPTTSTSTTNPNQQIPPSPSRASSVSTTTTTATSLSTEPQAQVPGHSPNPPPISAKPSLTQPPIQQPPPPSQFGHTLTFPCGDKPMSKSNDTMRDVIQCINFKGLSGGGDVLYRRRVKRVGWEVLKHWEIWGLDVQEI
ncbi:conserved hypothetical protein [Histoplasma capsulatum var. duboisii H88]|uniref:ATP synthase subunit A domain-containing protein n=1 Tax=Ajellomyces capsulatus (strain H88) TaxID=544711 RepID=F0UGY2_AJEC8|nr:conserved hypothetical protein [Histoplasma capsulatum var. duboisii H88]QSS55161.1 ATP synthase subunit A domain-containing protein [Histoplasma capsulatum var. duboisii H88]